MNLQDIKENRDKVRAAQFEAGAKMFLDKIFSKLSDDYPNSIFYSLNNEIVAEYNDINFYYSYKDIFIILSSEFRLNEVKIKELVTCKAGEHLKLRGIILDRFAHLASWLFYDRSRFHFIPFSPKYSTLNH